MTIIDEIDALLRKAGWEPSTDKATGEPWPFARLQGSLWVINGIYAGIEHSGARTDALSLARDLIAIGEREKQLLATPPAPIIQTVDVEKRIEVQVDNPDHLAEIARLKAENEDLRNRTTPPPPVTLERAGEGVEEIPVELEQFTKAGETPTDFRKRAFVLLQRFGVAEGDHGPDTAELSPDEKKTVVAMIAANGAAGNWLQIDYEKLKA